jgi:hypothetical protein
VNTLKVDPGSKLSVRERFFRASAGPLAGVFGLNEGAVAIARTSPVPGESTKAMPPRARYFSTAAWSSLSATCWMFRSIVRPIECPFELTSTGVVAGTMRRPRASRSQTRNALSPLRYLFRESSIPSIPSLSRLVKPTRDAASSRFG